MRLTGISGLLFNLSLASILLNGCAPQKVENTSVSPVFVSKIDSDPLRMGRIAFIWGKTWEDTRVFVLHLSSGKVSDISPSGLSFASELAWSPDGQYLAFSAIKDGQRQVFKMKFDGTELTQLTSGRVNSSNPSWSPDGKLIVFESGDNNILDNRGIVSPYATIARQIYVMNSDGSNLHRVAIKSKDNNITVNGSLLNNGFIAVSEIVTRYAYANYVIDMEGTVQKQFPEFWTGTSDLAWSPDGRYVIFSASRADSPCLGIAIKKTNSPEISCLRIHENVANGLNWVRGLSWSPDSRYIIFSSNLDGDGESDLYIIKPDGTELTQITDLPGYERGAAWSLVP